MKIKIGRPGTQEEMLEGDKARIEAIHKLIGHRETPHTVNGKIPYYFDANGRYEKKETLQKLLDHARKIGMFDQIAVIEEPFPEDADIDVGGLGVRIAADESAHTAEDVVERIQMGYRAIALKAAAKTLSMTLQMAKVAHENNVPCFLADLTCTPILVDWNKNVAARLDAFPELKGMGLLESNGHQNYVNWNDLVDYHPYGDASWVKSDDGLFHLDVDFYKESGGILKSSSHYLNLFA
jgi:L-alanine-DL-glutamate epimerase-like enolase superfamily enzyme